MKRMTDDELAKVIFDASLNAESKLEELESDLRKNADGDLVKVFRAIESAAYERAAQVCDRVADDAPLGTGQVRGAANCMNAIRALKDSTP